MQTIISVPRFWLVLCFVSDREAFLNSFVRGGAIMGRVNKLVRYSLLAATSLLLIGCTEFRASDTAKDAFIARSTVFYGVRSRNVVIPQVVVPAATPGQLNEVLVPQGQRISVTAACSRAYTNMFGSASASGSLELRVFNSRGSQLICTDSSAEIKDTLIRERAIFIPDSCRLPDGEYLVRIGATGSSRDSSIVSNHISGDSFTNNGVMITVRNGSASFDNGGISQMRATALIAAEDTGGGAGSGLPRPEYNEVVICQDEIEPPPPPPPPPPAPPDPGAGAAAGGDGGGGDPLIINMNPEQDTTKSIPVSAPWEGIFFNLFGLNAKPYPHFKNQVSWLHDPMFMWLVRPNANGQVLGIDQLFGNNTELPDKTFASHGFTALARFDGFDTSLARSIGAADRIIDGRDPVFKELKLWSDKNLDGIASPDELLSLESQGIESFDLEYDPNYFEKDKYGNRTVFRSVVHRRDGTLRLMFDIWLMENKRLLNFNN